MPPSRSHLAAALVVAMVALCAAAPPPDDERMILAHEAFVITFDASTVKIEGTIRRARTHIYLPTPDEEGFTSFDAMEQVDCKAGTYRYTDALGRKPGGSTKPMVAEKPGPQPIVKDTPVSIIRDHLCALTDLRRGTYGVQLDVSGADAARAVFALLKAGLEAKPAAQLASQSYADTDALTYNLDRAEVEPARRRSSRRWVRWSPRRPSRRRRSCRWPPPSPAAARASICTARWSSPPACG